MGRFFFGDGAVESSVGDGASDGAEGRGLECHDVVSCRCSVALNAAASFARLDMVVGLFNAAGD